MQKYIKDIYIGNKPLKCFIDFGSECSLINQTILTFLNLKAIQLKENIFIKTLSDNNFKISHFVNANVSIDSVTKFIKFYVIYKQILGVDILIGQNFTEQNDVIYFKIGHTLRFNKRFNDRAVALDETNVNIGIEDESTKRSLLELLNKFNHSFTMNSFDVGTCKEEMHIELTSNIPITRRPRRFPEKERQIIREIVNELLKYKIIRESDSPYASQVLLVSKKNGEPRLCVDFRALNKITVPNKNPLPLIEDQIDRLSGYKYFCNLDLASGYYQIKMAEDSIAKTAFVTQDGLYEFLKIPFGLTNAPSIFQKIINKILGSLRFHKVLVYLDDILVPGKTIEETLDRLGQVLQLFENHGLKFKLNKCYFLQTKIEFLGYEISNSTIKPTNEKICAVEKFPIPVNIHNVRQYLGLTSYFRKFIPKYAENSKPLSELLHKNTAWTWGPAQQRAFDKLKLALIQNPVLQIFDNNLECRIYTDASRIGIGGIFVQIKNSKEHPVAYFSKQTTVEQQKYHSFELETLAVVMTVQKFRHYIFGRKFTIITDCSAVVSTFKKAELNPRIGRWVLELSEYNYEIKHRTNQHMRHVDALSRNPITENVAIFPKNQININFINITEGDWLLAAQDSDKGIKALKEILLSGDVQNNRQVFKQYEIKGGKVYKITSYGSRWVVPENARFQILRLNHDDIGHFAFDKTHESVARLYWFPKMRRFIKKYVNNCLNCLYHKTTQNKKPGFLNPIPKIARPFHTIHIDHLGPFVKTGKGNAHIFVVIDAYSKFILIYPVINTKTCHVIHSLMDMIKNFGVPRRIISDRGTSFTSIKFKAFCNTRGITHYLNAVGLPRGNGQVERYNRTILDSLSTMGADLEDDGWDENIVNIQLGLNGTINKALGAAPSEVLMGYRVSGQIAFSPADIPEEIDVTSLRSKVCNNYPDYQARQKAQFDARRRAPDQYQVGDLVLLRITSAQPTGSSRKLLPKWRGPFRISGCLGNDRYEVRDIPGMTRSQAPYLGVAGIDNMKQWIRF